MKKALKKTLKNLVIIVIMAICLLLGITMFKSSEKGPKAPATSVDTVTTILKDTVVAVPVDTVKKVTGTKK